MALEASASPYVHAGSPHYSLLRLACLLSTHTAPPRSKRLKLCVFGCGRVTSHLLASNLQLFLVPLPVTNATAGSSHGIQLISHPSLAKHWWFVLCYAPFLFLFRCLALNLSGLLEVVRLSLWAVRVAILVAKSLSYLQAWSPDWSCWWDHR